MTRRSKVWLVVAVVFTAVNFVSGLERNRRVPQIPASSPTA